MSTISEGRSKKCLGQLNDAKMAEVDKAIILSLALI
ncbi:MAG: hypothetical protein JW932_19040 [Deltaproteobacteria bacterium]|nr:hypothetical protein [Deltaproteobacteria bacterium]